MRPASTSLLGLRDRDDLPVLREPDDPVTEGVPEVNSVERVTSVEVVGV